MRAAGPRKPIWPGSVRESHCFDRKHPAVGLGDTKGSHLEWSKSASQPANFANEREASGFGYEMLDHLRFDHAIKGVDGGAELLRHEP